MFETSTKFAALFCMCFEEGNARFLRFIKGYSVQLLSPSLMRNIGSACGIVGTAQGAEAEYYHIDICTAETESSVPIEPHHSLEY